MFPHIIRIEASRSLTEPEIIPMPYVTENNRVTLVLPISQGELVEAVEFVKRCVTETGCPVLFMYRAFKNGLCLKINVKN